MKGSTNISFCIIQSFNAHYEQMLFLFKYGLAIAIKSNYIVKSVVTDSKISSKSNCIVKSVVTDSFLVLLLALNILGETRK